MARTKQVVIRPTFSNSIDTLISSGAPGTHLAVDPASGAGNTGGATWRTLLRFPLDEIPASATIIRATVRLYAYQIHDTNAYNIGLHRSLVEWFAGPSSSLDNYSTWNHRNAQGSVTWSTAGGASGTEWVATATNTQSVQHANRFYEWDTAADVQDFVDGTESNYGWWIISADESTTTSLKRFRTSYILNPGYAPVLYVEYTEAGETDDWFDTDWAYRKEITIDSTFVDSDLTDFPLLVDLSEDADISVEARADLRDVFFTAADGITKLPHEQAAPPFQYATLNGAWSFFGAPYTVRHVGASDKTYAGWVNAAGDIMIGAYNHGTSAWEGPTTLKAALDADDHAIPTLLVRDSDGKIMVFYCKHIGTEMYLRVSTNAEDITSFAAEQTLDSQIGGGGSPPYEYPTPFQLTGETNEPIYLFYTNGGTDRRLRYSKSEDDGTTWSAETVLYDAPSTNYAYFHAVQNGTGRIDFVVSDSTPNLSDTSLYHFYYGSGNFYRSNGAQIVSALPLSTSDLTLVHDGSTNDNSWNLDIAIEAGGNPVIGYVTYPEPGFNDQRYRYARWNGSTWATNEIVAAGGRVQTDDYVYPGGLSIDHDDPSIVYLSRSHNGVHNIFKYTTPDSGATWTMAEQITNSQSVSQLRPVTARGAHADLPLFWLHGNYQTYEDYNTAILSPMPSATKKWWVRVPSITAASNTTIYVYYGKATAAPQDTPELVWEGVYDIVVHGWRQYYGALNVSNPPVWTYDADLTVLTQAAGAVYEHLVYPNTNRLTEIANVNQRGWPAISAEVIMNRAAGASTSGILNTGAAAAVAGLTMRVINSSNVPQFYTYTTALQGGNISGVTIPAGTRYRVAMRYNDAGGIEAFVDKTAGTPTSSGGGSLANSDSVALTIGYISTQYYTGTIEEIRLTSQHLSTPWLDFAYDNVFDTTLAAGTEEEAPTPPPPVGGVVPRSGVAIINGIGTI